MSCDFVMIRHGETDWNNEKRLQGRSDIPLNSAGIAQIKCWQLPTKFENWTLYTSPLSRAQQTASLIFADQKPIIEKLLIEMSFGDWEGQQLNQLRLNLGKKMQVMENLGLDFLPPNGESPRMVQARLLPFLTKLANSNENSILICHKAVIRAVYAAAAKWDMKAKPQEKLLDNSAHHFHINNDGEISITQMNILLTRLTRHRGTTDE